MRVALGALIMLTWIQLGTKLSHDCTELLFLLNYFVLYEAAEQLLAIQFNGDTKM